MYVRIFSAFALRKKCFCSTVAIAYFPSLKGQSLLFVARPNPNLLVRQCYVSKSAFAIITYLLVWQWALQQLAAQSFSPRKQLPAQEMKQHPRGLEI